MLSTPRKPTDSPSRSKAASSKALQSRAKRIARTLALGALLLALLSIAYPLLLPDHFITDEQLAQLADFFFSSSSPSASAPPPLSSSNSSVAVTGGHTNNWAVLVCTSKFWFNYRHMANTLGMYRTVKRLGIPDSNIILMLADDAACNPRNKFPGKVWANDARRLDLYGENVEVDYRGYEVSVENLVRVLTGRTPPTTPRSKRLESDARSNVFLYMTGHGGDEFLKFQDYEEISAFDIADAIEQMWEKKRYHHLFFMIDTCQANTMYSRIYSPNVLATGSSRKGQNSYSVRFPPPIPSPVSPLPQPRQLETASETSIFWGMGVLAFRDGLMIRSAMVKQHQSDSDLGVAMIDRFTNHVLEFMEDKSKTSNATMQDLFDNYNPDIIHSNPGVRADLFPLPLDQVKVTDFFGGVAQVQLTKPRVSPSRLTPSRRSRLAEAQPLTL
ncbi:glycosylphosphatidylinositol anchor biosynthesis [Thecaphora frezii]